MNLGCYTLICIVEITVMVQQIWLNLPVKDLSRAKEFFMNIGFKINPRYGSGPDSVCLLVGVKETVVMLFTESVFEKFCSNKTSDTKEGSEFLISFVCESREEVDEMTIKVKSAGGLIFCEPVEMQGWMYGFGFADLDGHRWNMLYMDYQKAGFSPHGN